MPHFPMFIDIKEKPVLIVGGGKIALRKIKKLQGYGPCIHVVALDIIPEILEIEGLTITKRAFQETDLEEELAFVIAATDDKEENRRIAELCHSRKIMVNVVDDLFACGFLFPALVQKGTFSAGISTGGASPVAAAHYRRKLEEIVPENIDEILSYMEAQRESVKRENADPAVRAKLFHDMFDECLVGKHLPKKGSVALVGAGCGKADLITVRGLRLLQKCQAVVYDDLIDEELLREVPESAIQIYVGKRFGVHSKSQEEINDILIALAEKGLNVVRLKGGDPYLFGRGGEEMLAIQAAGISCQEVPGIPSAIGIPAESGIPVTHRGVSRSLYIVTAHTSDTADGLPANFDVLAKMNGTLVFLMGLRKLPLIVERLREAGMAEETPIAVISGGNAKNPKTVRGTFATIEEEVKKEQVEAPAIILVGEVARFQL